jgi:hypothetical protein
MKTLSEFKNIPRITKVSQSVMSYKFWIATLFVNYVFIDFARRFFEGEQKLLILLDINIVVIFLIFFYKKRIKLKHTVSISILQFTLALYIGMIIIQVGNFSMPDMVTTLAGIRAYLLPVPFLWIGYCIARQRKIQSIEKASKLIFSLSFIAISFGCYMFLTDSSVFSGTIRSLITPLGHAMHSFNGTPQELVSSFFASSSRFSMFLLIAYLFIWGEKKWQGKPVLLLFVLFLVGFIMAGNRTGFFIFILFNIIVALYFYKRRLLVFIFISAFSGSVYYLIDSIVAVEDAATVNSDLSVRMDYMIDDFSEYVKRVDQALPISRIKTENNNLFFGMGLGKYGQEARLSPSIESEANDLYLSFFEDKNQYPSHDSGLVKLMIEIGLIGVLLFCLFFGAVIINSFIAIARGARCNDYFTFAIGWFPIFWLSLFLKGHPVISDIFTSSVLYMSIGFILAGACSGLTNLDTKIAL